MHMFRWVWGTVKSGIQTIPRDMTYHPGKFLANQVVAIAAVTSLALATCSPGLKRVVYAPVKEMATLHTATLDHTTQRVGAMLSALLCVDTVPARRSRAGRSP